MTMTDFEKATIAKYEKLTAELTRGHTARECGRLLYEATSCDDVLRDAVSAVLAVLDASVWSTERPINPDINTIKDAFVGGFTNETLLVAARRHNDRNPDQDEVAQEVEQIAV